MAELVVYLNGRWRPVWALRAGQAIVRTDWDHDNQRMTVWVTAVRCSVTGMPHRWTRDGISGRWLCADCQADGGDAERPIDPLIDPLAGSGES